MNSRFIQHSAKYLNHPIQVIDPIQTIHLPTVTTLIKVNLNSLIVHWITGKL